MRGYFIIILLLLVACTSSMQTTVDQDARVQNFLELFPEATYSEAHFTAESISAISDIIAQDCNTTISGSVTRSTYRTAAATLTAYTTDEVICVASKLNPQAFELTKGDPSAVAEGTLVTVNSEPITTADVDNIYVSLNPEAQVTTTPEAIINVLIDQKLLQQAAGELPVADFIQQQFPADIPTEAAKQFYLDNPSLFIVSEQVTFRQIYIAFPREQADTRLQQLFAEIPEAEFCDLVTRYSVDEGGKANCGEYTTPRGIVLPAIEQAIFSMEVGEVTVVESETGHHVLAKIAHTPTAVIPYAQAESQVLQLLRRSVQEQQLQIFLLKLRAEADIVDYT